jgi:preprotein translocase subunit SecD
VKRGPLLASISFVLALVAASLWGFLGAGLRPQLGLDLVGGVSVILTAPPGTPQDVMERTLETIRERVDALGVAEPDITLQGDFNIQVQIPRFEGEGGGGRSQERLLELVGQTARLELREVKGEIPPGSPDYQETEITRGDDTSGQVVFPAADTPEGQDPVLFRLGRVLMTGDAIDRATATFNDPAVVTDPSFAGWVVDFRLDATGATRFGEVTRQLRGKQMAIVLDRRVESAPFVNDPITGGEGTITLANGTAPEAEQEAKDLALVLRVGALPVELEQSQVETVSATLGEESLRQGLVAGIAGLVALCLYLAFYYRLLGVVTWFGMAIWGILALSLVSVLGQTVGYSLTLAGVAGIVVSLGIAADSYIVFYERLKDEVRHGKTLRTAVQPAFRAAWRTIIAANTVAILGALVLYLLAIGSVRGFALTLGLSTLLDIFVVYFFKRPTVFVIARSRFLSDLPGMGLRSGVASTPPPQPVRGGAR